MEKKEKEQIINENYEVMKTYFLGNISMNLYFTPYC